MVDEVLRDAANAAEKLPSSDMVMTFVVGKLRGSHLQRFEKIKTTERMIIHLGKFIQLPYHILLTLTFHFVRKCFLTSLTGLTSIKKAHSNCTFNKSINVSFLIQLLVFLTYPRGLVDRKYFHCTIKFYFSTLIYYALIGHLQQML